MIQRTRLVGSKLSADDAARIKARWEDALPTWRERGLQSQMAAEYGVSRQMIHNIVKGKCWAGAAEITMPAHVYEGFVGPDAQYFVRVAGRALKPRRDVLDHGAASFGWGSNGPAALQLALAMLLYEGRDRRWALERYVSFAARVIARLPAGGPWQMTSSEVRAGTAGGTDAS